MHANALAATPLAAQQADHSDRADTGTDHTDLSARLSRYIDSHGDDACQVLGLPAGTPIGIAVDADDADIALERGERAATLRLSAEQADRVLAYGRSFGWANGVVVVPTLATLVAAGAFDGLAAGEERAMLEFARSRKADPEPNLGTLWGALNLIALQGWLRIDGAHRGMRYRLTESGACAVDWVRRHADTFARAAAACDWLQHAHALCHRQRDDADAVAAYAALVELSDGEWGLAAASGRIARRTRAQLLTALDGLLAGPTWVALDMPVLERRDGKLERIAPSVLEAFADGNAWSARERGWPDADPAFLRAAWALMQRLGQIEDDGAGRIRLSAEGRRNRPIAAPYAGLPASYLRSYARLQDLLFGDPDPLGVGQDQHIDRVMNVYASSGAGSGPATREINEKIVRRLFDDTPLEQQPAGIADMGCGDAIALKRLAEYVIAHTRRGQHLQQFPLLVVGADYNEAARTRARATLAAFDDHPYVHTRVVHADISKPARYDDELALSGLRVREGGHDRPAGLRDFLHTFMFLVHNRRLAVRSEADADAVLLAHLRAADRGRLRAVLERYVEDAPAVDEHAELPFALEQLKALFQVAFGDEHGLVPGFVAAADLVDFMGRWKPYIRHGFLAVEGHSPKARNLLEDVPEDEEAWMRKEKLPHSLNWGMHFVSRQFMMPFDEFMLAMSLAGFGPRDEIYGGIHPRGIPSIDRLARYRFFSIADYVHHHGGASV